MNTNPFDDLKQEISSSGILGQKQATGFHECYCPVCGDTRRKTGGFKLDHDVVIFQCFRASCDGTVVYKEGEPMSRKFRSLMEKIGVTVPLGIRKIKNSIQKQIQETLDGDLYKKNHYKEMKVPDGWISYEEDREIFGAWEEYMEERCCSMADMFYIDSGPSKGLVAQACYFYDRLIGFQVINPFGNVKYFTKTDNENILFINERSIRDKVIVVEGLLDAKCFPNAVSTLSSTISPERAYHLRGKDVILLPDRTGNSFIDIAKKYGWKLCIPDWSVKDLNAAVVKYGVIETAKMINDGTISDPKKFDLRYGLWKT